MHSLPSPSASTPHCPVNLDAAYLKVEGFHAEVQARDLAARKPLSFSGDLSRGDLILIGRALRSGWPIAPATLSRITSLVMQARLSGQSDRLVSRARALMDDFPEAFRTAEPVATT